MFSIIRDLLEEQIKVACALIPQKIGTLESVNDELHQRIVRIELDFWSEDDLLAIPCEGFRNLNIDYSPESFRRIANECGGVPQTMQRCCKVYCEFEGIKQALPARTFVTFDEAKVGDVLKSVANMTSGYEEICMSILNERLERKEKRRRFIYIDNSVGDFYRCALLVLKHIPQKYLFQFPEILNVATNVTRKPVRDDTKIGRPSSQNLETAFAYAHTAARNANPETPVIDWDARSRRLSILDPYFLFLLRNSDFLERHREVVNPNALSTNEERT